MMVKVTSCHFSLLSVLLPKIYIPLESTSIIFIDPGSCYFLTIHFALFVFSVFFFNIVNVTVPHFNVFLEKSEL